MAILIAFFGFFALMSAVALIRFEGNPLFIFTLLLSSASLVWLIVLERDGPGRPGRKQARRKERRHR